MNGWEALGSLIPAVVPESRLEPFRVNYLKCRVSCAAEFQPKFHENFTEKKNRKQKQEKNHERPHTQQDQDKTISRPAMRSENRKINSHRQTRQSRDQKIHLNGPFSPQKPALTQAKHTSTQLTQLTQAHQQTIAHPHKTFLFLCLRANFVSSDEPILRVSWPSPSMTEEEDAT